MVGNDINKCGITNRKWQEIILISNCDRKWQEMVGNDIHMCGLTKRKWQEIAGNYINK